MYTNEYPTEMPTSPFDDMDFEWIMRSIAARPVDPDDADEDEDEDDDEDDEDEDKDSDDEDDEDEEEDEEDDDDPDTLQVGNEDMTLTPKPGTPTVPPVNSETPKPHGQPPDAPSNVGDDHMGATEDQVSKIPAPTGQPFKDEPKQG